MAEFITMSSAMSFAFARAAVALFLLQHCLGNAAPVALAEPVPQADNADPMSKGNPSSASEEGKPMHPTSQMSDRERNGLRGLVKSCIEERSYPSTPAATGPEGTEFKYGQKTEYDVQGHVTETRFRNSDGSEWVSLHTYDASGRPLQVWSGKDGGPMAETLYVYDDRGKLLSIRNSGSPENPVVFRQDEHGRKIKMQVSRPADYRPNVAVGADAVFEGAAPNLPGGGSTTTIYDEQDRPVEVQVRDAHGEIVSRAIRTYDEQGRIVDEKQVLDNPETIIPAELRAKVLQESGASIEELRTHLTKLMGGQTGPVSVHNTYDARGQIKQTLRRIFNREQIIESTYNEQGDKTGEITREKRIGAQLEEGNPPAGPPSYSEVSYSYEYDEHGNWTRKTSSYRSAADAAFQRSTETRRTLTYH